MEGNQITAMHVKKKKLIRININNLKYMKKKREICKFLIEGVIITEENFDI
jgi:hypothetical protein